MPLEIQQNLNDGGYVTSRLWDTTGYIWHARTCYIPNRLWDRNDTVRLLMRVASWQSVAHPSTTPVTLTS